MFRMKELIPRPKIIQGEVDDFDTQNKLRPSKICEEEKRAEVPKKAN